MQNIKEMLELEKRKLQMSREQNRQEIAMRDLELTYSQTKTSSKIKIAEAMSRERTFNDFRAECKRLIRRCHEFEELFDENFEAARLNITQIMDERNNTSLEVPTKLYDASDKLIDFCKHLQMLRVISDEELDIDYTKHRVTVMEKCDEIESAVNEIIVNIEIQREEDGTTLLLCDMAMRYGSLKQMVKELGKLVQQFNFPPSERVQQTISREMEVLSVALPQVTNGVGSSDELTLEEFPLEDINTNKIVDALSSENSFNNFGAECERLVERYRRFEHLFDEHFEDFKRQMHEIVEKEKNDRCLDKPTKLVVAFDKLIDFWNDLQMLRVTSNIELEIDYMDHRETVMERCFRIRRAFSEIIEKNKIHREIYGTESERSLNHSKFKKSVLDIKPRYGFAKHLIKVLRTLVQEFDTPPSERFFFNKQID